MQTQNHGWVNVQVLVVDVKSPHPLYIAQNLTYFVNLLVFEINLCATTTAAAQVKNTGTGTAANFWKQWQVVHA